LSVTHLTDEFGSSALHRNTVVNVPSNKLPTEVLQLRIFVTGGAGYIGSVVTEVLLDSGHEVVVFENFDTGHRAALDPRANLTQGDVGSVDAIREAVVATAPAVMVHMAAYIQMGESMQDPGKYFRNNTAHTLNVLDAMRAADVQHIVFSSTAGVYGMPQSLPMEEDHPIDPLNPYSESKRQVENIIHWYAEAHGISATVFRFFNAAGATVKFGEDHRPESHLIPIVLQVAQGKRPHLDLYGTDYETHDGSASRDYIHVRDLAQAHLLAIEAVANRGGDGEVSLYNIGSEEGATNLEVIEMARRVTGRPIPVRECPRRPGDAPASLASSGKIRRELGWEPQASDLETIIGSAWDWLQRHPQGYDSVPSPTGRGLG
jgi:UDP-glucose 4-epimerase